MFHFTKGVHVKTRLIITVAKVPTSHERAMQVYWEQCAWGGIRKHLNDEKAQMPPRSLGKNVCHMEIPAKNPERAAKFYSEVFNWDVKEWNKDPLYYGFTSGPKNSPWGWCDGGFLKIDEKAERTEQAIIPYYNALPIEDYEKKVTAAGGKVIVAKNKTYFGTIARCEDTEGNSFVLYDHHM
ncbi:hypothetical protein DFS34DRAFT_259437 [Phlyctochytrium arcticum]|nr:hypothetical protein DFS34DRAFT_259437 [Phlyctochytrium arcticum]